MIKRQFYLTPRQNTFIEREAQHYEITAAEMLRRIIDAYIDHHEYYDQTIQEVKNARHAPKRESISQ